MAQQDFDLALPILREGRCWEGMRCQAWVSLTLIEGSPRVWKGLREYGTDFRVLDDQDDADLALIDFRGIEAALTIAETNQSLHRYTHRIATRAHQKGIPTYTMHHEFENIEIAAQNILHKIAGDLGVGRKLEKKEDPPSGKLPVSQLHEVV